MYTAEHEQDLQLFFLEPPYFKDVFGDPAAPSSSIVFGHRGEGKSTICNMINYELQKDESNKVLVVPYMDFSAWNEKEIRELSLKHHLERILGLSVEKLIEEAKQDVRILENLESNSRSVLQWFVLRFLPAAEYQQVERKLIALFDSLSQTQRIKRFGDIGFRRIGSYLRRKKIEFEKVADSESKIVQATKAILTLLGPSIPGSKDLRNETMLGLLHRFKGLILSAGFASMYILVDKVDEIEACSGNYDIVAKLVSPMVTSLRYLETKKVATKLFLPMQVREILGSRVRTDRILTRNISWSKESLSAMLRKRLLAFSDNKIETLEPFVEPDIWNAFEQKLFYYAALCPRNLIRITDHVIAELCELEQNPNLISEAAVDLGIKHFLSVRMGEEDAGEYQIRLRESD